MKFGQKKKIFRFWNSSTSFKPSLGGVLFAETFNLQQLLIFVTGLLFCLSGMGYLSFLGWFSDLSSHFRFQYSFLFLLILFIAGIMRKPGFIILGLIGFCLNLPDLMFCFHANPVSSVTLAHAPRLKIMQMNVLISNRAYSKAAKLIQQWNPDILALQEISPEWLKAVQPALKQYPYFLVLPKEGPTTSRALFSRFPFKTIQRYYFSKTSAAGLVATLTWQGQLITVVTLHPLPPVLPSWYDQRNEQLAGMAQLRPSLGHYSLVVGDLNNTPFSPSFKRFLTATGLQDSRAGFGYQASWPSFFPPLQIPIDHVLISPDWVVLNRQVGPFTGSDHFPVLVELALPQAVSPVAKQ